jgi:hypothetical protein
MDNRPGHDFFAHPTQTLHRRYEALRAVFLDQRPLTEVAQQFGYRYGSLRNLVAQFRAQCRTGQIPPIFATPDYGRPKGRTRDHQPPRPDPQATADRHRLALTPGRCLRTRVAGVFLFLPLLARLRFDDMVAHAGYPGSGMVPAPAALLSLLTLKLLDKERRSHITDFDFDEALGLFAGLNVLPKKSYATDYSYRTTRSCQHTLLSRWVAALAPLLFPDAQEFGLDFHPIPHRGDPEVHENHYLPMRGKAAPSLQSFFAHEPHSRVLCYSNANLTRADQAGELMRFVDFWHDLTGHDPQWLYFDSKGAPYSERVQSRHCHRLRDLFGLFLPGSLLSPHFGKHLRL